MQGTARVWVHHRLIWLADASTETDGDRELAFADLLGSYEDESAVMVWPGIHTGTIEFTWALHDEAPPADRQGWDDVAEAMLALPSGVLAVRGFSDDEVLVEHRPGRYAVRCWARGRDLEHDGGVVGIAQETFHLDLWLVEQLPPWVAPEPLSREQVHEELYRIGMALGAGNDGFAHDEDPVDPWARPAG
ncbi:hypothetical protein [Cellulomonas edaphi]|uniref:Uncharacterized protein n=1 Tax=Cellulomonas edaphi TaxID=3053468 RepID=A0ABT7S751_9CELL|nr:hypothetical protein [Cellulomons edaphi]MDM7830857.1 hypothetical protein [Cellulomons edaphi]